MAARGLAAADNELADAFFYQACCDLTNGRRLLDAQKTGAGALAVAQFQQCCEKALKAVVLIEVGRPIYDKQVKPTHQVWSVDLRRLTQARQKIEKQLIAPNGLAGLLEKLESYAPVKFWVQVNTEYPWVDTNGIVETPVDYFESKENEISGYLRLAKLIVQAIAAEYPRLRKMKAKRDKMEVV